MGLDLHFQLVEIRDLVMPAQEMLGFWLGDRPKTPLDITTYPKKDLSQTFAPSSVQIVVSD